RGRRWAKGLNSRPVRTLLDHHLGAHAAHVVAGHVADQPVATGSQMRFDFVYAWGLGLERCDDRRSQSILVHGEVVAAKRKPAVSLANQDELVMFGTLVSHGEGHVAARNPLGRE